MWKRIEYADWVDLVPIIAFVLTFTVFVVLVVRAFLMKKSDLEQLAALPLDPGRGDSPTPAAGRTTDNRSIR